MASYIKHFIYSVLLSLPVTGFIYGIIACEDCDGILSQTIGRIFIGFIFALNTTFTLGVPYENEAGTLFTNLRIYVLITTICLFLIFRLRHKEP